LITANTTDTHYIKTINPKGNFMNAFVTAVKTTPQETLTENGMRTLVSSLDPVVDLFFKIGARRGGTITAEFERAFQSDANLALRVLLWSRDVRGGAGERELFRQVLRHLEQFHPAVVEKLIPLVPEFGRWDDLLVFETAAAQKLAFEEIRQALGAGNALCSKWMPREKSSERKIAQRLRAHLGLTPRAYRKLLADLSKTVETKMCAGDWKNITYDHVPSLAAARYQRAFARHDETGYAEYRAGLVSGTRKVNAGAVYPYDVIKSIQAGGAHEVIGAQWQALPNYLGDQLILPMVDVSGSMCTPVGGNANLTCMDVAVSLGLYISDRNTGAFHNMFLTFSERAKIEVLHGDVISRYNQLMRSDWGMSTDLHAAFDAVLNMAVKNSVPAADMPAYVLILSDMQFNSCVTHSDSAREMIQRKYQAAGYELPKIVFWNIQSRGDDVPVKFDESGTALVSGFSPSIMTSILAAENFTPLGVMMQTLNQPRYALNLV
jgi:hypothetical protein